MRKPSPPAKPEPEPEKFERWTAQRKTAIILEVLKGQISVPEACVHCRPPVTIQYGRRPRTRIS